jgi:hypothetical protein
MALIDNLVSYYKLDETSGDAIDSVGSNDGTVVNATQGAAGKIGTAYSFDGDGDYINVGQPSNLNFNPRSNAFTIVAWIKVSSAYDGTIIAKGPATVASRQYQLYTTTATDTLNAIVGGTAVDSGVVVTDDNWHQVGLINYDDSGTWKFRMFVDGVLDDTITASGTATNAYDVLIGARRNNNNTDYGFVLNGSIDEVGIWNRALTSDEINELYHLNVDNGITYPFTTATTKLQLNIGDVWKEVSAVKVNIGDTWKECPSQKLNIGDTWKEV